MSVEAVDASHGEWSEVKVAQSCPALCDPMDYTVHGMLQARILEWVAFPFSRRSSQPRDRTQVSRTAGGFFTSWATRGAQEYWRGWPIPSPGDLPDPGIELGSPALQADSLPSEQQGSPRILEWAAYPFSRGSSRPRNWTGVSYIAGGFFTSWATRETQINVRTVKLFTRLLQLSNSRTFFIGTQKEKKPWTH